MRARIARRRGRTIATRPQRINIRSSLRRWLAAGELSSASLGRRCGGPRAGLAVAALGIRVTRIEWRERR